MLATPALRLDASEKKNPASLPHTSMRSCRRVSRHCRRLSSKQSPRRKPCTTRSGLPGTTVSAHIVPNTKQCQSLIALQGAQRRASKRRKAREEEERAKKKKKKPKKSVTFSPEAASLKEDSAVCIRLPKSAVEHDAPWSTYLENVKHTCVDGVACPFMDLYDLHRYGRERLRAKGYSADHFVVEPRIHVDPSAKSNHLCLVPAATFDCRQRVLLALSYIDYFLSEETLRNFSEKRYEAEYEDDDEEAIDEPDDPTGFGEEIKAYRQIFVAYLERLAPPK